MMTDSIETTYDGVKVFSATMARTRDDLSGRVDAWLARHPELEIISTVTTQSSDSAYHCLTVTLFYRERGGEIS